MTVGSSRLGPAVVFSTSGPETQARSNRQSTAVLTRSWACAIGALGFALCAISMTVALGGSAGSRGLVALGSVSLVGIPWAVGVYAGMNESSARFGRVLLIAAFVSFLATLAQSPAPFLYSTGRVSYWCLEALIAFLILSFPSGRLTSRIDRLLVFIAAAIVVVLFLPSALLVTHYLRGAPYVTCTSACPPNRFFALGSQPAFIADVLIPVRSVITVAFFTAMTLRLLWRIRASSPLTCQTLTPVLAVAIARTVILAGGLTLRASDPASSLLPSLYWLLALTFPALALGFLIGLLRWELYVARALQQLAPAIWRALHPGDLSLALSDSFEDPTLRLIFPDQVTPGRWTGSEGEAASPPSDSGSAFTEVWDGGRVLAGIVHDAALEGHTAFTEAVAAYTLIALQNQRLSDELRTSLREVSASRARILAAADNERRRIERDLHDGAQQRLVALRMRLELAGEAIDEEPQQARARLSALAQELTGALEEIRNLARGVYPPLLASEGLPAALRSAALRTPISTTVAATNVGRYSEALESAVYFCCLEAIQNASKYATGATQITIALSADDRTLHIAIRDDGAGFEPGHVTAGAGLANMSDRLAALGGGLAVTSAVGEGTCVDGQVPLAPAPRPGQSFGR